MGRNVCISGSDNRHFLLSHSPHFPHVNGASSISINNRAPRKTVPVATQRVPISRVANRDVGMLAKRSANGLHKAAPRSLATPISFHRPCVAMERLSTRCTVAKPGPEAAPSTKEPAPSPAKAAPVVSPYVSTQFGAGRISMESYDSGGNAKDGGDSESTANHVRGVALRPCSVIPSRHLTHTA